MKEPNPDSTANPFKATLDGLRTITVRFELPVPHLRRSQLSILDEEGRPVAFAEVRPLRKTTGRTARIYAVKLVEPPSFERRSLEIELDGYAPQRVQLGRVLSNRRFHDAEARLGATYSPQGTLFGLFAPHADAADLVVARTGSGRKLDVYPMSKNQRGVWSAAVQKDLHGQFYAFKVRGPGHDPDREVTDIYARCAQYPKDRAMIADLSDTDPPGFQAESRIALGLPTDAILYELHVRDFTIAANSGVTHNGIFLGLAESGTHLPGAPSVKTGLDHLVDLGITHVQLMPVQCFEHNVGYNWGYMTVFFDTVEGRYATTRSGDARIREFKQAVQAFHDRGIGVILDVVYNHTSPQATFDRLAPGYYYRRKPNGEPWNGSGCGNELHTEHPMCQKYILDSLKYWVSEFGVDGFRFDLMGLMGIKTLELIRDGLRAIHPSILLYGEPWAAGPSGLRKLSDKQAVRGTGIGAFNDNYRNAIKGDPDGPTPGFMQAGDRVDAVKLGIRGAIDDWAMHPSDTINYIECHDNLTAWDKLRVSAPVASNNERQGMQKLAALLILTSQGVPFIHCGQEFCRTKHGHHNTYNMPDEINQVDWSAKQANLNVYEYFRGLIALRKSHPVFRLSTREEVEHRVHLMNDVPSPKCIAFALDGRGVVGESFSTALILINGDDGDHTFPTGPGRWLLAADADRVRQQAIREVQHEIVVPPHSGVILHK